MREEKWGLGGLGGRLGEGLAIDRGFLFANGSPFPDKDATTLCFDEVVPVWSNGCGSFVVPCLKVCAPIGVEVQLGKYMTHVTNSGFMVQGSRPYRCQACNSVH